MDFFTFISKAKQQKYWNKMSTNKIWNNLEMVKTFLIKDRKCRNNEVKKTQPKHNSKF